MKHGVSHCAKYHNTDGDTDPEDEHVQFEDVVTDWSDAACQIKSHFGMS
jgi:hypothetical protein